MIDYINDIIKKIYNIKHIFYVDNKIYDKEKKDILILINTVYEECANCCDKQVIIEINENGKHIIEALTYKDDLQLIDILENETINIMKELLNIIVGYKYEE